MKMSLFEYDAIHKGIDKAQQENVKRMIKKGLSLTEISDLLDLSEEEVRRYMEMPEQTDQISV